MNTNLKAVVISDDEFSALAQMSASVSFNYSSEIEEILTDKDSFVIQAKDEEGNELDDFLVINSEKRKAVRFINSVSSDDRCAFLIPFDIVEEILQMMTEREENIH